MFFGRVGLEEDLAMLPMDWYEPDKTKIKSMYAAFNGTQIFKEEKWLQKGLMKLKKILYRN